MSWLALPFLDENKRKKIEHLFQVNDILSFVVLDKQGKDITTEGVKIIREYDVEGYPFTAE